MPSKTTRNCKLSIHNFSIGSWKCYTFSRNPLLWITSAYPFNFYDNHVMPHGEDHLAPLTVWLLCIYPINSCFCREILLLRTMTSSWRHKYNAQILCGIEWLFSYIQNNPSTLYVHIKYILRTASNYHSRPVNVTNDNWLNKYTHNIVRYLITTLFIYLTYSSNETPRWDIVRTSTMPHCTLSTKLLHRSQVSPPINR